MIAALLKMLPANWTAEVIGWIIETVLIVGLTFHFVSAHYELEIKAARADEIQKAATAYQALTNKYNDAASALESAKANHEVVFSTITKEVPTIIHDPVYLNNCLDAAGMRLINNSLAGKISTPASIASAALPAASAP